MLELSAGSDLPKSYTVRHCDQVILEGTQWVDPSGVNDACVTCMGTVFPEGLLPVALWGVARHIMDCFDVLGALDDAL